MTDCNRQGVGGIRRLWKFSETEEPGHHKLHLLLFGQTVAHDTRLYTEWRVLCHRKLKFSRGQKSNPAYLAELEGGFRVDRVENLFNSNDFWLPAFKFG